MSTQVRPRSGQGLTGRRGSRYQAPHSYSGHWMTPLPSMSRPLLGGSLMRAVFALVMLGLVGLAAGTDGHAQGPEQTHRLAWEHAERLCQFIDKGSDGWVEVDKAGRPSFHFKEVQRNCDFVELFDTNRGYTLRLYKGAMYIKGGNEGLQRFED